MIKPRVFVTCIIPEKGLQRLSSACDVHLWESPEPDPCAELLAEAAKAEGLLTLLSDPIDAAVITAAPHLRAISQTTSTLRQQRRGVFPWITRRGVIRSILEISIPSCGRCAPAISSLARDRATAGTVLGFGPLGPTQETGPSFSQ